MVTRERESFKLFRRREKNGRANILGIAGSTCTGKSTLSSELLQEFRGNGLIAELIAQDDFYKEKEHLHTSKNAEDPAVIFYDYDQVDALNHIDMLQAIRKISHSVDVIIVEGNMIRDLDLFEELDHILFLTIAKDECRIRRMQRIYDPPDEKGYFDQVVWPAYERTLARAKEMKSNECRIAFLESNKVIALDEVIAEFHHLIGDQTLLIKGLIDPNKAIGWVSSPSCGAITIFIGTTRDIFEDKAVKRLEYEAYDEMAYLEMANLCKEARTKYPQIEKIYICHRLGEVPVGEASVIIACNSIQRNPSIEANKWLINTLKERIPIWKREVYTNGSCSWKQNKQHLDPEQDINY